jgi:hypothetical protein
MSAKKRYLWAVFDKLPQSPKLVEAALIFYHSEVPVAQACEYLRILSTKIKGTKNEPTI